MLSRVEPFGMATVEGMGMGCLPVAWDIDTGTSEIIEPGRTGFTAPLGDAEALARAVQDALAGHEERVERTMDVARAQFSEEAMWARYSSLLEGLSEREPVRRPAAGETPPEFSPPTRYFQLLPDGLRNWIRRVVGRSPRLGYWLRGFRGI